MNKTLLALGGFGLAALAGAFYTESLLSFATRRRSVLFSILKAQKEARDDPALGRIIHQGRATLHRLPMKRVCIHSTDGLTLTGRYLPAQGEARRTLLLAHGWRSSWGTDFGPIAPFLHQNGCNLLLINQRGQGDSQGTYITFGVQERLDLQRWVKALARNPEPLYLYGVSMGAASALMATALPMAQPLTGVIADCGYTSPQAIMTAVLERDTNLPSGPTYRAAARAFHHHAGLDFDDCSALEAMKSNDIPTLFIHGDADPLVPVSMTWENYRACRGPKEILIVPGAVHAASSATAPQLYQETLLDFFQRCEKGPDLL